MRNAWVMGISMGLGLPIFGADLAPWPQYGGPTRDFIVPAPAAQNAGQPLLWRRPLGPGTSAVITDGRLLFSMYSVPDNKDKARGEEVVVALDPVSGDTKWEHRYAVARLKGQETFSGDPVRPQATPAVADGRLCTLGYAGLLKCFDAANGRVAWQTDLVKDLDATPVQFGFAASPLVLGDCFVVHVGGKQAAVIAFRIKDGTVAWKTAPAEPSYASPVLMRLGDDEQIVQVTRDEIVGVAARTGQTRWTYPMPKPGLTNVPTPVGLPGGRLLVSGQGLLGTRLLQVVAKDGGFDAAEVWANDKEKFFYCNWIAAGDAVYGNNGTVLCALDPADGKQLWRERGQAESNGVRVGDGFVILRGDGQLTRARLTRSGIEPIGGYKLLNGRCWTAPTVVGDVVYARDQAEVAAVRLASVSDRYGTRQ